jgi:hypothetical protein
MEILQSRRKYIRERLSLHAWLDWIYKYIESVLSESLRRSAIFDLEEER